MQNPTIYNPSCAPSQSSAAGAAQYRLQQMQKAGYLTSAEVDSLSRLPIQISFHRVDHKQGIAPYFREHLRKIMMADKPERSDYASWQCDRYRDDSIQWEKNPSSAGATRTAEGRLPHHNIYTDGLKIYTTISPEIQRYAEEAMREYLADNLQPRTDA